MLDHYQEVVGVSRRIWVVDETGTQALQEASSMLLDNASVFGNVWFVDKYTGSNSNDGISAATAFATIQFAIDAATSRDAIIVAEGSYDEVLDIPRTKAALKIIGAGNHGSTGVAPSGAGEIGLTYHCDDLTLINFGVAGDDTATAALTGTGSRLRTYGCKIEGVTTSGSAVVIGPGSVAAINAGTEGNAGDIDFYDTEFAWSFNGLALKASDYGVPTQVTIHPGCRFHNISGTQIIGVPASFGIGSVRNLEATAIFFDNMEDGTAPSDRINVNTAFDTGMFTDCSLAMATNAAADIKIGAGIKWVANYTEAGCSTARPA